MNQRGRVLIFTGDGKGKTTAALGMALRAAGHDMRVLIIQFIKKRKDTGEISAVENLPNIEIVQTGLGFVPPAGSESFGKHKGAAEAGLIRAAKALTTGAWDVIVLDEICGAVGAGLLEETEVIAILQKASSKTIIVLTGRNATQGLIDIADTVTEMRCIKHGFQTGWDAQKGVEL